VPIAAAGTQVLLTADQLAHAHTELELMSTLVKALPHQEIQDEPGFAGVESASPLTPAQGQAWRAVRVLLFEHDPARAFGDLRRVPASSGEFLWICPDHYAEYDPGLPSIPGT
jgi:hypothetical protein